MRLDSGKHEMCIFLTDCNVRFDVHVDNCLALIKECRSNLTN